MSENEQPCVVQLFFNCDREKTPQAHAGVLFACDGDHFLIKNSASSTESTSVIKVPVNQCTYEEWKKSGTKRPGDLLGMDGFNQENEYLIGAEGYSIQFCDL